MEKTNTWLTTKEALAMLRIKSRTTLWNYCKKFNVRATKPRGKIYYCKEDIQMFLDKNSVGLGI